MSAREMLFEDEDSFEEQENVRPNHQIKQQTPSFNLEHIAESLNPIEIEAKKISSKEEELMRKAKDLENEMKAIRQAKIDVVVKQFEQQLIREAELEEKRHTDQLRDQYEQKVGQVEAEKAAQISEVDKMLDQIRAQIEFLRVVAGELETKKGELVSTSQASVHYLRREMAQSQKEHKEKLIKHIAEKKEIFKNYIATNREETQ